jgi:hypothetical protein
MFTKLYVEYLLIQNNHDDNVKFKQLYLANKTQYEPEGSVQQMEIMQGKLCLKNTGICSSC